MKLLLTAINAKYIHSSLSVLCLKSAVRDICDVETKEYSINDTCGNICSDIYRTNAGCVAFSCYIWNIDMVLKVASMLKKAKPDVRIILGGHEVMFDAEEVLKRNSFVDVVIRGEGEYVLKNYITAINENRDLSTVDGITYRQDGKITVNPDSTLLCDLNDSPFVYEDCMDDYDGKIIYYETSRGCPFGCTYCISGANSRVRFLDAERVKKELKFFMDHKIPLVKFVDRTFNANLKRAKEIFRFIAQNPSDTVFHMELTGDNIDDETIEIISKVPKGKLRFEIGVQTTNPQTMEAIERKISFEKLSCVVKKLIEAGNVHVHLDLIAGLPYENLESFKKSFEDVISLRPNVIQLGFLKLLKGSKIRGQDSMFGYVYADSAPYEVISNDFMTFGDILEIKSVEENVERFYNSESFSCTMNYLFEKYSCKYDIFLEIAKYFDKNFSSGFAFSKQKLFDLLYDCFSYLGTEFFEALKKDYLMCFRVGKRPVWFDEYDSSLTGLTYTLFKDEDFKKQNFPMYYDVPAKEIMKHIHPERFSSQVLLFDYKYGKMYDITSFVTQVGQEM